MVQNILQLSFVVHFTVLNELVNHNKQISHLLHTVVIFVLELFQVMNMEVRIRVMLSQHKGS